MDSRRLRDKIDLLQPTDTRNASGEVVTSYSVQARPFAEVKYLTGNELHAAQQTYATATVRVRIRTLAGLTARHQVRFKGRTLSVNGVIPADNIPGELLLFCTEVRP